MPGIPSPNSDPRPQGYGDLDVTFNRYQEKSITQPSKSLSKTMAGLAIRYLPPQMDPLVGSSTRSTRNSPLWLFIQDAAVLFTMLPYLPYIFLPFKTQNTDDELYTGRKSIKDMFLQGWLFFIEVTLLLLAGPALLILPGLVSLAAVVVSCLILYLLTYPMEGPNVAFSNMDVETEALAEQHRDERWLFVNGCAVSYSGLQSNIDRLSKIFGRAVIGVHNKTYGLPGDLLECIIQRCFSYKTRDTRVSYSYVKAVLLDPTIKKVVLIGHSQGGIIISLVVDQLFAELPTSCMSKLEIYTFGSAASHFSNPLVSSSAPKQNWRASNLSDHPAPINLQPKHVIPHIEHYANEYDMVPRWGVLHFTQDILKSRYSGSVFVRLGASGHMFNQHYMDAIFPLSNKKTSFLDTSLNVDEGLATKRENVVMGNVGTMRFDSGLEFGNGQTIQAPFSSSSSGNDAMMTFGRTNSGRLLAEEARGKTVRELSRLWRYEGGRSPFERTEFPKSEQIDGLKPLSSIPAEEESLKEKIWRESSEKSLTEIDSSV